MRVTFVTSLLVLLAVNTIEARAFIPDSTPEFSQQYTTSSTNSKLNMSAPKDDAEAYNKYFSSSIDLKNGYVRNGWLTVSRSVRDVDNNKRRSFLYHVNTNNEMNFSIPPAEEPSSIKARVPSPSGQKVAIFMKEKDSDTKKTKQVMEIWGNGGSTLQRRIVLPTDDLHGDVCTDTSWFGGMSWRPHDEDVIVYVAETKARPTKSFFDSSETADDLDVANGTENVGGQYTLGVGKKEDWGEKYVNTATLRLFCVSTSTGQVRAIENIPHQQKAESGNPDTYTLGQPVFSSCGNNVIYTAWDAGAGGKMPRKLGSIYCYQRSSFLYSSSVCKLLREINGKDSDESKEIEKDEMCVCLTPDDALARSARFTNLSSDSKSTTKLAFLCSPKGYDTHGGCMELHTFDWDCGDSSAILSTRKTLVNEVRLPSFSREAKEKDVSTLLGMSFPGIFTGDLPQECFSPDGSYIFLTSMWGSVSRVLQINTETGAMEYVPFNLSKEKNPSKLLPYHSQQVICTSANGLIVTQSAPNQPPVIGLLPTSIFSLNDMRALKSDVLSPQVLCNMTPIACSSFSSISSSQNVLDDINNSFTWEVVITERSENGDKLPPVQSILLTPTDKPTNDMKQLPLIVVPHGGPHSCFATTFIPSYAYLCGHGKYAVLLVNYHGSTGFGQDSLEALAGTAGTLDVKDVWEATNQVVTSSKNIDVDRVGICGGSHGGYLAGHLIGKYPELYKVAAMRNPVTNIATMVTATDIPDWTYVETFGPNYYDFEKFRGPNKTELAAMWDASPIATVENVKAPTLIALGMMDRRVPPSQGLEFYHTLRSKNIKTKLLVYEKDVHAIDIPISEADHWVNIKRWFDENL